MIRILKQLMNGWCVKDMGLDNNIHSFTENTTKKIAKFDGKFTQGNAVYHADNIACALMAQPVGNMGGYSSLYLVEIDAE